MKKIGKKIGLCGSKKKYRKKNMMIQKDYYKEFYLKMEDKK